MAHIIIPREHQACPRKEHIYLPDQIQNNSLITPELILPDTELRGALNVKPSLIHGYGLYSQKTYHAREVIWYESFNPSQKSRPEDDGPLRWTNHSDTPNSLLVLNLDQTIEATLIALSQIPKGEEITYDYNIFGHQGYRAACNCQQSNCRGSFVLREEWGEKT